MCKCTNKHFAKFLWKFDKGFLMMKLFAESKKTSSCGPFEIALSGCRHRICIRTVSKLLASLTGKSLSEALIFASIACNQQYDDRLFMELPVQYKKTKSAEHILPMFS
mgnify:CR=1 FL=1